MELQSARQKTEDLACHHRQLREKLFLTRQFRQRKVELGDSLVDWEVPSLVKVAAPFDTQSSQQ